MRFLSALIKWQYKAYQMIDVSEKSGSLYAFILGAFNHQSLRKRTWHGKMLLTALFST